MITLEKIIGRIVLQMQAVPMGKDLSVTLCGGDRGHIGAVALGIPRPSIADTTRMSSTVSVLAIPGHKEDQLARTMAQKLASALNATVCVSCGIHIEHAESREITDIVDAALAMTEEIIQQLKLQNI